MAKIGNVVDVETAIKWTKALSLWRDESRAVIWPKEWSDPIVTISHIPGRNEVSIDAPRVAKSQLMPQRKLVHFICDQSAMIAISVRPTIKNGQYVLCFAIGSVDYDSNGENRPAMFAIFSHDDNTLEQMKREVPVKMRGLFLVKNFEDIEIGSIEQSLIHSISALEEFAFSTVATTKLRPSRKISSNRLAMKTAAIEIVHLRLPEPNDDSQGSGHSINVRYWVKEHLRKQWYPSEGIHKLIVIKEHWRGPEDAPVKPKTEKVYKVTR